MSYAPAIDGKSGAHWLLEEPCAGRVEPDRDAACIVLADKNQILTYADMDSRIAAFSRRFDAGRGILVMPFRNDLNSITCYLAALRSRIPVLVSGDAEGHEASIYAPLYRYDPETDHLGTDADDCERAIHPDLALLLSTSGSTGSPKFVRLSRLNLLSNAWAISEYLGLDKSDRAITSLPLHYSYGLSILNSHLFAGASIVVTQVSPATGVFWDEFERFGCTSFAGVPQSFVLLEKTGLINRRKPALRYMTQAGGRLAPEMVRSLAERGAREGWSLFVMYGQTEASPRIAYLPPEYAALHPASIGRAIPGGRLTLEAEDGSTISEPDQEGELVYEGPNVMMGYALGRSDLKDGRAVQRLRTGDLARKNRDGLYFITGRKSRFIKIFGKRIALDQVEAWLDARGCTAVCTGRDEMLGALCAGDGATDALEESLAQFLQIPRSAVALFCVDAFPYNANGKIDYRAALALFDEHRGARLQDAEAARTARSGSEAEATIMRIFAAQFAGSDITPDSRFTSLGGTSNDFIDVELSLEEVIPNLPENWHLYAVRELAAFANQSDRVTETRRLTTVDFHSARALACILVVAAHVIGATSDEGLHVPTNSGLAIVSDILSLIRMPLFAFLAGAAFTTLNSSHVEPRRYFSRLLISLLVPTYMSILLFALSANVLKTQFAVGLADWPTLLYLPYAHFWFAQSIFLLIGAAYAVSRYGRRILPLAAIAGLIYPFLIPSSAMTSVFAFNGAVGLAPYFTLGMIFVVWKTVLMPYIRTLFWVSLSMAVAFAVWLLEDRAAGASMIARSSIAYEIGAASILVPAILLAKYIPFIRNLAPYAFHIYLWHVFGTSATRRIMDMVLPGHLYLSLFAGIVMGIAVPILATIILSRLNLPRVLSGLQVSRSGNRSATPVTPPSVV